MTERRCKLCSKAFQPIRGVMVYCSARCRVQVKYRKDRERRAPTLRHCQSPECHHFFFGFGKHRYCSRRCQHREQARRTHPYQLKHCRCPDCQNFFAGTPRHRYCSPECRRRMGTVFASTAQRQRNLESARRYRLRRFPPVFRELRQLTTLLKNELRIENNRPRRIDE